MILDKQSLFSDRQKITATAPSDNTIDAGKNQTDLGWGTPVPILIQVTETFTGLTSLTIAMEKSDDPAFGVAELVYQQVFPVADLKAGARVNMKVIPYGARKRYFRLKYTCAGTPTAGRITAGITLGNDETPPY